MQLVSFNLTKKFQHFNLCLNRKCKFCHLSISVYHCSSTSSSSSSYSGKLSLILSTSSKDSFQPSGPSFISWSVRRHLSSSAWMNWCLRAWPMNTSSCRLSPYSHSSPLGFLISLYTSLATSSLSSQNSLSSHIHLSSASSLITFPACCQPPITLWVEATQRKPLLLSSSPMSSRLRLAFSEARACSSFNLSSFSASNLFCLSSRFFLSSSVMSSSNFSPSSTSSSVVSFSSPSSLSSSSMKSRNWATKYFSIMFFSSLCGWKGLLAVKMKEVMPNLAS